MRAAKYRKRDSIWLFKLDSDVFVLDISEVREVPDYNEVTNRKHP
ncbi:MAG: hypothetical protein ABSF90_15360 [Syntrophobacteraceae bacterium]|jgi:chemotaxis signal transduction protein